MRKWHKNKKKHYFYLLGSLIEIGHLQNSTNQRVSSGKVLLWFNVSGGNKSGQLTGSLDWMNEFSCYTPPPLLMELGCSNTTMPKFIKLKLCGRAGNITSHWLTETSNRESFLSVRKVFKHLIKILFCQRINLVLEDIVCLYFLFYSSPGQYLRIIFTLKVKKRKKLFFSFEWCCICLMSRYKYQSWCVLLFITTFNSFFFCKIICCYCSLIFPQLSVCFSSLWLSLGFTVADGGFIKTQQALVSVEGFTPHSKRHPSSSLTWSKTKASSRLIDTFKTRKSDAQVLEVGWWIFKITLKVGQA